MIETQEQLMEVLAGKVNASFHIDLLRDDMDLVVENHVHAIMGDDLYKKIADLRDDSPMYPVRKATCRTIAYMALSAYLETGAVMVSSSGITRFEDGPNKSAYRYQEERYRNAVRSKGWQHWESVLKLLDTYAFAGGDFSEVGDLVRERPEIMDLTRGCIVPFSHFMRQYHGSQIDRLTFDALRPIIKSLEREGVAPMMGANAYANYMGRIRDNDVDTITHSTLTALLQEALCLEAVSEGLRRFMIQITDGRVVLNESDSAQDDRRQMSPDLNKVGSTHDHLQRFRTNALDAARRYMDDNASAFPGYLVSATREVTTTPVHQYKGIVSI